MAPVITDEEELKPKPSESAMKPCEEYEDFKSKDVKEILKVIARNAEKYFRCSSSKDEAILYIRTTQDI